MHKPVMAVAIMATLLTSGAAASAGPWEDGMAAYNRGDYVPALRLFRPLAEQGNAKAQAVLGVMFRKGEGVPKNASRAYMWFSLARKGGEIGAKASARQLSRSMTQEEVARAEAMANACEASNYRQCEY